MIADPYLATNDVGKRRIIVSYHMRTHLPKGSMSCTWYRKNYRLWYSRAYYIFNGNWNDALQYTFTTEEINEWEKVKKEIHSVKITKINIANTIYTKDKIIELFKDEYIRLKSIPDFGHFSFQKYEEYKNKELPWKQTIRRLFGSAKSFYMQITKIYPDIYFDPIPPYNDEDCEYALTKAYKDYGFISYDILDYNKGYIDANTYAKRYGSLENACKKFNIPYEDKIRCSKLFLMVKKEIEKLLPSIEIIEEKKWPWLIYINPLSVDIFLPFFNLAIEVDGKQHEKEVPMWDKDKESLQKRQARDNIKNIELPKHNITLIRIKYSEIHKIPEILKYYVELLKTIQEYCAY